MEPTTSANTLTQIFLLITLGAAFIFFVKGVWEVNSKPDDFKFVHFIGENTNRLFLLGFGLIVTALILYLDPVGLTELFDSLPISVKLASPLITGASLSAVTLVLPRKSPPAMEP